MSIVSKSIEELQQGLQSKQFSSREITTSYLKRIEEVDSIINAYITVTPEAALKAADDSDKRRSQGQVLSPLDGIPIAVKDNFCTHGVLTSCASKILYNFVPPYDAFCWQKLQKAGAVLTGKTNLDEFAMGSGTESSAYGATRNPFALEHIAGGSSGGSAAAVAADMAACALGTDTGGSVRQPAHHCGVVGVKPTYGRVSRNGVIPFASSMDQAGVLAKSVLDAATVLEIMAGYDAGDATSVNAAVGDYRQACQRPVKGLKIGIPAEFLADNVNKQILKSVQQAADMLRQAGATVETVSLPHTRYALPVFHVLSAAEASSNMARYDGVNFGLRVERNNTYDMMTATRSEGFGAEVKTRIILGTYVLSISNYQDYYLKAMQIRTLIKQDYDKLFDAGFDCLLSPVMADTARKLGAASTDLTALYTAAQYVAPHNLAGLPAMSLPFGMHNGLPLGVQIVGRPFGEEAMFSMAAAIEQPRLLPPDIAGQAQARGCAK